jgi:hypothetical protein
MQVAEPGETCVAAAAEQGDEAALLDVSQACLMLSRNVPLHVLSDTVEPGVFARYLAVLEKLSHGCIAHGGASVDNATEWQGQATSAHYLAPSSCARV